MSDKQCQSKRRLLKTLALIRHMLLSTLLSTTLPIVAIAQANPSTHFSQGVQAAKQGRHEQAVNYFLKALQSGTNTAALHYNLGVSYYKLSRLEQARSSFLRAAEWPKMAAPAYYNLGLIAEDQNKTQEAQRRFTQAYKNARTDKMRRLSLLALNKHGLEKPYPRWLVWTEFGGGHDSNALLVPPDLSGASEESDIFLNMTLYGHYNLAGSQQRQGLRLHGLIHNQRYTDLDDFNYSATELGISYPFENGTWRSRIGLAARSSTLGDEDFQDSTVASVGFDKKLTASWTLRSAIHYESIDPAPSYSFLEGEKTLFDIKFHNSEGWQLLYSLETNDRTDLLIESTNEFRSFSPTRQRFGVEYQRGTRLQFVAGASFRKSRYDDADRGADGTFGKREDDQQQLFIGLTRRLESRWLLRGELRFIDNESNFSDFDYTRTTFNVSLDKSFEGF